MKRAKGRGKQLEIFGNKECPSIHSSVLVLVLVLMSGLIECCPYCFTGIENAIFITRGC